MQDTFYALRSDYGRLSHGMYALELCAAAIQPEQENERLFLLLLRSLAHLCYGVTDERRVTAVFLMGMTSLLGFRPQVGRCARCGRPITTDGEEPFPAAFAPQAGGVLCPACGVGERCRLTTADVAALQDIMRRGLESLEREAQIGDELFAALRAMAEEKLDVPVRSGRLLT